MNNDELGASRRLDRRTIVAGIVAIPAALTITQLAEGASGALAATPQAAQGAPVTAKILSPAGVLSVAQRQAMIQGVTEVLVQVVGRTLNRASYVTVLVNEMSDGGWGVAGHGYTLSEFPELVVKGARSVPNLPR